MSVLSNVDIEHEIIKDNNIRIYPLDLSKIKGSTYNLTASEYAWSIDTEKSIVDLNERLIKIPPHDTGLIATKEVIWVSEKLCGTYHSKVAVVSVGGGHIGTTLDSTWIGHSIIAVHNHTEKEIEIGINDTFVSIMFHYLNTPTTKKQDNNSSQTDKLPPLSKQEKTYFDESWKKNSDELLEKVKEDKEYQKLLEKVTAEEEAQKQVVEGKKNKKNKWVIIIGTIVFVLVASWLQTKVPVGSFYYIILNFLQFAGLSGLFMPFYTKILNK